MWTVQSCKGFVMVRQRFVAQRSLNNERPAWRDVMSRWPVIALLKGK
jgi:hypothetical protein